ncbi:hypothetical protein V5O48_015528 [Marasmius crinis-equi]|uniref:Uncharacterized protein n=1 Tax=Marasmius crinis-equi TaxID=585013 RepID=A0ABR3EUB4_9AGAR
MADSCRRIPGNPDISGIGVRASVYAQAFLAALNTSFILIVRVHEQHEQRRETSTHEAGALYRSFTFTRHRTSYFGNVKNLERSIFMIGFAVIVSAIVQTRTGFLSAYHALIVLNIGLVNNFAGLMILLSRVVLSSSPGWKAMFFTTLKKSFLRDSFWCMAHSTLMGAFGAYFWAKPLQFQSLEHPPLCTPLTQFWAFQKYDISNRKLRIWSLIFYSITLIPIGGLIFQAWILLVIFLLSFSVIFIAATILPLPMVFGAWIAIIAGWIATGIRQRFLAPVYNLVIRPVSHSPWVKRIFGTNSSSPSVNLPRETSSNLTTPYHGHSASDLSISCAITRTYARLFVFFMPTGLILPVIYAIISTENIVYSNLSIVAHNESDWTYDYNNRIYRIHGDNENDWTYGQTLALFSALVAFGLYGYDWWKMLRRSKDRERVKDVEEADSLEKGNESALAFCDYMG